MTATPAIISSIQCVRGDVAGLEAGCRGATAGVVTVRRMREVYRLRVGVSTAPPGTRPGQRLPDRAYHQRRRAPEKVFARPCGVYVRWRASTRAESSPQGA